MSVKRKKDFNIDLMLKRLSEQRTINDDGSIGFNGFGVLDEYETYLRTAIEIHGETDAFVSRVVRKAMNAQQLMTSEIFLGHCTRILNQLRKSKVNKFKIVFPIFGSIAHMKGRKIWSDVTVTLDIRKNSSFAKKAMLERDDQIKRHKDRTASIKGSFHQFPLALCSVSGVDIYDAFQKGERAISKELGLYSVTSSRGQFIFTDDPRRPINTILLAPYMTIHDQAGNLSGDIFW